MNNSTLQRKPHPARSIPSESKANNPRPASSIVFLARYADPIRKKGPEGETEKTIHHLEAALEMASSFNLHSALFWAHHSLA